MNREDHIKAVEEFLEILKGMSDEDFEGYQYYLVYDNLGEDTFTSVVHANGSFIIGTSMQVMSN